MLMFAQRCTLTNSAPLFGPRGSPGHTWCLFRPARAEPAAFYARTHPQSQQSRRRERFEDVLQLLKRHLSVCFARAAAALLRVRVHDRVVVATVVEVRKADSVEGRSLARCPCLIRLVELRSDLRSDGSVTCST
jgi:hypothetical protein